MSEVECIYSAHVQTPFPDLANGWEDCVQILCVTMGPIDTSFTQVRVGCICTCARAHPSSISRNLLGGLRLNLVCG